MFVFNPFFYFKYRSSLGGGSPSKLSNKMPGYPGKGKAGQPSSAALVNDMGIVKKSAKSSGAAASAASHTDTSINSPSLVLEDSFEKYYNKDLDLEEDQVPVVIYELNESALNFISQEQYEKALILLQKA